MKAILITKSNLFAIIESYNGPRMNAQQAFDMVAEYDPEVFGKKVYFTPALQDGHGSGDWASIPEAYMVSFYVYDKSRVDTEFVEIVREGDNVA